VANKMSFEQFDEPFW